MLGVVLAAAIATPSDRFFADYPANHREIVDHYLQQTLKDPMSAQVQELRGPRLGTYKASGGPRFDGYIVCYSVNAKNSYGAYVGATTYLIVIAYGAVQTVRQSPYFSQYLMRERLDQSVEAECARLADPTPN